MWGQPPSAVLGPQVRSVFFEPLLQPKPVELRSRG